MTSRYKARSRKKEIDQENLVELEQVNQDLREFKDKIILKYSITYSKTRIAEHLQCMIDLIDKRIIRKIGGDHNGETSDKCLL